MNTPLLIWLAFSIILLALSIVWPNRFRCFAGLFFITMGLGVNAPLLITAPGQFEALGAESLLPVYRDFFRLWIARYPVLFVVPVIVFQVGVGILMLGRGRRVRIAAIAAIGFLLAITPLHILTLPNVILAAAFLSILSREFELSFPQIVRDVIRNRKQQRRMMRVLRVIRSGDRRHCHVEPVETVASDSTGQPAVAVAGPAIPTRQPDSRETTNMISVMNPPNVVL